EDDEVDSLELDLRHGFGGDAVGELDARQAIVVPPAAGNPFGLLAAAAAELDFEPGARQQAGECGAHRAGADDRSGAQCRQAAEPLVLKLDAGPDARGDLARQVRRGLLDAREGQRTAAPDAHLERPDQEPAADSLGAVDRYRDDWRSGLEREPADAALRLAEGSAPDARALGEDHDRLTALDEDAGRLHRLLVGLAAANRERAEGIEEPTHPALLEQLALGDEVDGPPEADADDPRIEEAAV